MTGATWFLIFVAAFFFTLSVLLACFAARLSRDLKEARRQPPHNPARKLVNDLKEKCKAEIDSRNARIEALQEELETERDKHRAVYVRAHLQGLAIEQCRGALAEIRPPDEPVSHDLEEK